MMERVVLKNIFSYQVETYIGVFFVSVTALFFLIVTWGFFSATKAEISALSIHTSQETKEKLEERLINRWIQKTNLLIPANVDRYTYVRQRFPEKDWLFTN